MGGDFALDVEDYSGQRVTLASEVWDNHIQHEHPEVAGRLEEATEALKNPDIVYEDQEFPTTHLYYRLGAIDRFRYLYLTVVVRCDLKPARVLTMYVTREPSGSSGRLVYATARQHN